MGRRPGKDAEANMEVLTERQKKILGTLVDLYVETVDPVSSCGVLQHSRLKVSPATVRNDLAELEEFGLVRQPHTSAGRVPTDSGYRLYVDELVKPRPVDRRGASVIRSELMGEWGALEEILLTACRLLSRVTEYTSVVLVPTLRRDAMKLVQLGTISPRRLLVILVTTAGHIENRVRDVADPLPPSRLTRIGNFLNDKLKGRSLSDVKRLKLADIDDPHDFHDPFLETAFHLVQESIPEDADDQIIVEGIVYMLDQPEFSNAEKARTVMEAFETRRPLSGLLVESMRTEGLATVIGHEQPSASMHDCSFVGMAYRMGNQVTGSIGVLGPTRMQYAETMPLVRYMARRLGECLTERALS